MTKFPDIQVMHVALNGERRDIYFRKNTSDIRVFDQVFKLSEYDLSTLRRYGEINNFVNNALELNRPPLIIDGGANIGISPLFFMSEFPGAKVVAVEPDPYNFEMLNLNLVGTNIDKYQLGITSSKVDLSLDYSDGSSWGVRTTHKFEKDALIVQSVGINELYMEYGDKCTPFIVKLDVEGAEREIFSSNVEWLKHTPILIIELHDWMLPKSFTAIEFLRAVSSLDRDFIILGENIISISHKLIPEFDYANFCAIVSRKNNFPSPEFCLYRNESYLSYASNSVVLEKIKLNMKTKLEILNAGLLEGAHPNDINLAEENVTLKLENEAFKAKIITLDGLAEELASLKEFNAALISRGKELAVEIDVLKKNNSPKAFDEILQSIRQEPQHNRALTQLVKVTHLGEYKPQVLTIFKTGKFNVKAKVLIFINANFKNYPNLQKFLLRFLKLMWWTLTLRIFKEMLRRLGR